MCEPAISGHFDLEALQLHCWVELSPLFLDFIGTPQKSERKEVSSIFPPDICAEAWSGLSDGLHHALPEYHRPVY